MPSLEEIAEMIERRELQDADSALTGMSSSQQDNAQWWLLRGLSASKQGLLDQAAECFEKAHELDAHNTEAIFQLAYIVDLRGDDEDAIDLYRECISQPPLHVNAIMNLAVLLEDHGRYDEAEAYLQHVLDHYPNHKRAALFLKDVISSKNMYYDEDLERSREKRNEVLDIPISDFELSVRSRNCLKKMQINTLGDLLKTTEAELLSYKNFGETSLNEIKAMLSQKGLHLGQALEDHQFSHPPAAPDTEATPLTGDMALLQKPVSELELSVRSRKCLQRLGITTLAELSARTESELLSSKNFGQTSLEEIKQRLAAHGLDLRNPENRG